MTRQEKYDPNAPETEEDGIRAEALRRLKVHQLFKGRQDQTLTSSTLQKNTQQTMESTSKDNQNM